MTEGLNRSLFRKRRLDGPCYVFRLLSATHFATSLLPLTVRLIPVITEIGRLIVASAGPSRLPKPATSSRLSCTTSFENWAGSSSIGRSTTSSRTTDETCPTRCVSRESGIAAVPRPPTARWPPSLAPSPSGGSLSTAPRRRAVDLSLGDPLGAGSRFGHTGSD